jgi:hypothetical protein
MDLGDMIRRTVELDDGERQALATACEIKANVLAEMAGKLSRTLGHKTRVGLQEVIDLIESAEQDYRAGADPDYWTKP